MRKPGWLDTAVGIAGLSMSAYSLIALASGSDRLTEQTAVIAALAFGLLIVVLSLLFRPRHSFDAMSREAAIRRLHRLLARAGEIVLVNPAAEGAEFRSALASARGRNVPVSIVTDPVGIHGVLESEPAETRAQILAGLRLSGLGTNEFLACIRDRRGQRIEIVALTPRAGFVFALADRGATAAVLSILKRDAPELGGFIGIGNIGDPYQLVRVAKDQERAYLRAFRSMQEGRVSFYGNEVQIVQSGWVESGDFSRIDTLDLTFRPDRLLERHRYNAANRTFVAGGGRIRRCYMVRPEDLDRAAFRQDLARLCDQQREIGVEIGLLTVDTLPLHLRKDFILYDDSIVLVEDQQATADYALGRSTAYFARGDIASFREEFDEVWLGRITGAVPTGQVDRLLGR